MDCIVATGDYCRTRDYELELVNDHGLIIPHINFVEFDSPANNTQPKKSFRRFVKLQPAMKYRLVNTEKTTLKILANVL